MLESLEKKTFLEIWFKELVGLFRKVHDFANKIENYNNAKR